jgi:hypothetical protein
MIFSLGADTLSYGARQVAVRFRAVREFYGRQKPRNRREADRDRPTEAVPNSLLHPPTASTTKGFPLAIRVSYLEHAQIYRICPTIWMSVTMRAPEA